MQRRADIARALVVFVALTLSVGLAPAPTQAVVLPEADLQVVGSVEDGPPGGGITTGDTMEYRLTIRNQGPAAIPARSILLAIFVDRADSSDLATIEVARFNSGNDLVPASGGDCGNGRRLVLQCTNRQAIDAGEAISLRIAHRHPAAEAGALSFVAEVSGSRGLFTDPATGNNSFRGPTYGFINPPTTTTTSTTTTTVPTSSTTTSTTDPSSTTTSESTTTSSSSTTSSSTTTTTTSTTTTTTATSTTSTTLPSSTTSSSTTAPTTTTTLTALVDDGSLPTSPSVQGVEGAADSVADDELLAGPTATDDGGGPPYLLLAALVALALLLGGLGLALYVYLNRAPPLVDIRRFD